MVSTSKIAMIAAVVAIVAAVAITVPLVLNNQNEEEQKQQETNQSSSSLGVDGKAVVSSPVAAPSANSNSKPTRSPTTTTTTDSPPGPSPMATIIPPVTTSSPTAGTTLAPTTAPPTTDTPTAPPVPAGQVQSFTSAGGIDYYHCVGDEPDATTTTKTHHIFLLHGASFDRDVWLDDTEILRNFCKVPGLRVSALDLPVSANYQTLQTVIDDVAAQQQASTSNIIATKPVVLVTPSASGYSMVSWMLTDNVNGEWMDVPNYIETWVPVAPVALSSASDDQIVGTVGSNNAVPVLAIYGDGDSSGGRLSERLGSVVGATVVELSGGHPVYLQSEDEFVQNILDFIGESGFIVDCEYWHGNFGMSQQRCTDDENIIFC